MSDLNQCSFIGRLGKDPEVKTMQSGDKVANLSIAVAEKWKDKSGERKESTTWVPIVIWGPLAGIAEKYLRKASRIFVQGKFRVRKWQDQSGQDRYSTEVVLQGPGAVLTMLDGAPGGGQQQGGAATETTTHYGAQTGNGGPGRFADDLDDDIPFATNESVW